MNSAIRRRFASAGALRRLLTAFAPYLGAGVRITEIAEDFSSATVEMHQRWYNTNYVGTHFGGSLYSMVDPMYMLLLMRRLGLEYIVWDKSASIDFIRPGKGRVTARFELTDERVEAIREAVSGGDKHLPTWDVDIVDDSGELVARVHKVLYVRKKAA
ncbi:MAG: tetrameric acyl-CoA thioesterase [Marinobacter sp. 34-60-7]|nr:MAG: tetrameric acyl-CoA thioesterase [Marinobacter sp. 34-60-7]